VQLRLVRILDRYLTSETVTERQVKCDSSYMQPLAEKRKNSGRHESHLVPPMVSLQWQSPDSKHCDELLPIGLQSHGVQPLPDASP